jgi:hypothetical protein
VGFSHLPNRICIFFAVACALTALVDSSNTLASCGDYLLNSSDLQFDHSPSASFLSETIGVAKLRIPWQGEKPCNGPHCQQSPQGPTESMLSLPNDRNSSVTGAIGIEMSHPETFVADAKRLPDECWLAAGCIEEILRPPMSGVMVAALS